MVRRIPDGERLKAWQDFLHAHTRIMRALERDLRREAGITGAQYDVLVHLSRADDGRLRMSDLAGAVQYSSGAATKLLIPWSGPGWSAERDANDRRTVYAAITDEGRATFAHVGRDHLRGIQREFGALLPAEELPEVSRFLQRLAEPPAPE